MLTSILSWSWIGTGLLLIVLVLLHSPKAARRVVARRDREADLVVELGRRRNVAFLLNVESHAGGPDRIGATLRSDRPGDN